MHINLFMIHGRTLTDLFFLRFRRLLLKNNKNKAVAASSSILSADDNRASVLIFSARFCRPTKSDYENRSSSVLGFSNIVSQHNTTLHICECSVGLSCLILKPWLVANCWAPTPTIRLWGDRSNTRRAMWIGISILEIISVLHSRTISQKYSAPQNFYIFFEIYAIKIQQQWKD